MCVAPMAILPGLASAGSGGGILGGLSGLMQGFGG